MTNKNAVAAIAECIIFCHLELGAVGECKMIDLEPVDGDAKLVEEIISIQRNYYFEKRNVKTERQRKIRELIERASRTEATDGN